MRGQRQRQRRGDRRLAGAALAGDDVQADALPVAVVTGRSSGGASSSVNAAGRADRPDPGAAGARRARRSPAADGPVTACPATLRGMPQWEYATVPLIVHATKQILDQWGEDGWELVQVVPGPDGQGLVAYLKRPR